MGSISLIADGRGRASINYSTTASPPRTMSWIYAKLFIRPSRVANRESAMPATGGAFTTAGNPSTILFNGDISIKWFADYQNCTHFAGTYQIFFVYNFGTGDDYTLIESGTVSVSGPVGGVGCSEDTEEDEDDGTGGGDDTGGPYGTPTEGEVPEQPGAPTSDPCLPGQPTPFSAVLPTPCSGS